MIDSKVAGAIAGLVIGIVLVWLGWWQAIVVGSFGLLGLLLGKYLSGGIPIVDLLLERFASRNRE